jgi:hypothetical protein
VHIRRTYLFWGIIGLFAVAIAFGALYYRGIFSNYISRNVGVTPGNGSSSSTVTLPNVNASSTIQDVKNLALKFNAQGKLFLTWTKLSDDTYEVRIFRAKKGAAAWQLWKTVTVQGIPGNQGEINITQDEARTLFDYSYSFETRSSNGTTIAVSNVVSFGLTAPDENGNMTTTDTGIEVPPAIVAELPNVKNPGETVPPPSVVTPPASPPTTPLPSSTNPITPVTPPIIVAPPPVNTPPTPISVTPYIVYYYTPDGRISSTSTFPAPNQNFWVDTQSGKIELGWQNLPSSTAEIAISRSVSGNAPWESFFTQERPVTDRPYSIFLNDIGTISPFYYKLEAFDSHQALLSSYGPLYLNPAQ